MAFLLVGNGDTSYPLDLWVFNDSLSQTGLPTMTVALKNRDNNQYLDFNDNTFKAAAWITASQVLTEIGSGLYRATFNPNVATGVLTNGATLVAEFYASSGRRTTEDIYVVGCTAVAGSSSGSSAGGGSAGGFGNVTIKGNFTAEDRRKLFELLEDIQKSVDDNQTLSSEILGRLSAANQILASLEGDTANKDQIEDIKTLLKDLESKAKKEELDEMDIEEIEKRIEGLGYDL